MEKTLIIIPAFNEAAAINRILQELKSNYPDYDILVIDDFSGDQTVNEAKKVSGIKVLRLAINIGYGAALQAGYKYALRNNYDYLVQLDADGQHDPENIKDLLSAIEDSSADIVVGSRFLGKVEYHIGLVRLIGMKVFALIAGMTDPTSGFQAMNRKALRFYASDIYPSDFPDADVIIMSRRAGLRIKEIPVTMRKSLSNHSMHHGLIALYYVFKMFLSIMVTLIRKKPELEEDN